MKSNGVIVEKLSLEPNDVVIFHVDVGNMSLKKAEEYLHKLIKNFNKEKPFENNVMWFAHRHGEKIVDGTHTTKVKLCDECLMHFNEERFLEEI